jgi:TP901 family phage tail tape measure protein
MGGANELRNIQAAITGLNANLTNMNSQWTDTYTAASKNTKNLSAAVQNKTRVINTGRKANDAYGDSLLTVSQKAAVLRSSMLAMGTHVGIFTARTLLAATAAYGFTKAVKGVITVGASYTQSLAETSAIIGVNRSELEGLSNSMLELAEITKFTTTEVSQAATVLSKTGLKTEAVAAALPPVLNLAAIGSMDMAQAADIAANSMFGFRLQATDLEQVVDELAFVATNSNTSVRQLGMAMSYAAPVAAAANAEFADVVAMMGVMADSGIKASRAGTTLRRAYVNLLDPTPKVAEVLKDLGVQVRDSAGEMRGMVDIMADFAKAGGSAQDLTRIFGVRAAPGMIAIWKDVAAGIAGADSKLKDLIDRMGTEGVGASERMRNAMEKNLIDVWKKFESAVSVQATRAFFMIEEGLISDIEAMTEFVRTAGDVEIAVAQLKAEAESYSSIADSISSAVVSMEAAANSGEHLSELLTMIGTGLGSLGAYLRDLGINMEYIMKAAGARTAANIDIMKLEFKSAVISMKIWWEEFTAFLAVNMATALDTINNAYRSLILSLADMTRSAAGMSRDIGADSLGDQLDFISNRLTRIAGEVSNQAGSVEQASARKIKAMELERAELRSQMADHKLASEELVNQYEKEAVAKLNARDAAVKAAKDEILWNREAERIFAEMDRFNAPEASDATTKSRGVMPEGYGKDFVKSSKDSLKQLVKEQKNSIKASVDQIKHLEKLGHIDPFSALEAGIEKVRQALQLTDTEFKKQYSSLKDASDLMEQAGYHTRAKEIKDAAIDLAQSYGLQTEEFRKSIREQEQALDELALKYKQVYSGFGKHVEKVPSITGFKEGESFASNLRSEQRSPSEAFEKEQTEKLRLLDEAFQAQFNMQLDAQDRMYMSAAEYEARRTQLKEDAERERLSRSADFYRQEVMMEENLHIAKARALASGVAAYTAEGAKSSRKLFELNKAARMAQIIIDTPAAISGAYTHGAALGGPILGGTFALLAAANQAQLLQQARSATFDGGGTTASTPVTAAVPQAALDIPPQSDALFNQTNTGGQQNTVDSSNTANREVNFNISVSAIDAEGAYNFIDRYKSKFVTQVQQEYDDRGRRGGPLR